VSVLKALRGRFARDAVTLQAGGMVGTASGFGASLLLAHILGAELQGTWLVALSLYALAFAVLNVGVVPASVNQIAAAAARGKTDKVASWMGFVGKSYLGIGALLVGVGYWALPRVAGALGAAPEVGLWAWWLCFTPFLEAPRVVCASALQGTRRMLPLARLEAAGELVRLFLVPAGASLTGSPAGAALGQLASTLLGAFLAANLYRRARMRSEGELPSLRAVLRGIPAVPMRKGMPLGLRVGVLRNVDMLSVTVLPPLFLQAFASPAWVAYFRIAQQIMKIPLMLMQGVSRTALPALSHLAGAGDMERFRTLFRRVTLASGALSGLALVVGLPVARVLVAHLYPEDYLEPVWSLCLVLLLGHLALGFAVAIDSFYIAADRLRVALMISIANGVLGNGAMALLGHHHGAMGVAWGMVLTLSGSLAHLVYIVRYFRRHRSFEAAAASRAGATAEVG
jgi:O-antigen/teichoic acid export membrane protein